MSRGHGPTLQFFVVLLLAPLFAVAGVSTGGGIDGPAGLAGWLVTLALWSGFATRSVLHQWRGLRPRDDRSPELLGGTGSEQRLLVGVATFALFTLIGAVMIAGILVARLTLRGAG